MFTERVGQSLTRKKRTVHRVLMAKTWWIQTNFPGKLLGLEEQTRCNNRKQIFSQRFVKSQFLRLSKTLTLKKHPRRRSDSSAKQLRVSIYFQVKIKLIVSIKTTQKAFRNSSNLRKVSTFKASQAKTLLAISECSLLRLKTQRFIEVRSQVVLGVRRMRKDLKSLIILHLFLIQYKFKKQATCF